MADTNEIRKLQETIDKARTAIGSLVQAVGAIDVSQEEIAAISTKLASYADGEGMLPESFGSNYGLVVADLVSFFSTTAPTVLTWYENNLEDFLFLKK